jgi:hypothetical protein
LSGQLVTVRLLFANSTLALKFKQTIAKILGKDMYVTGFSSGLRDKV